MGSTCKYLLLLMTNYKNSVTKAVIRQTGRGGLSAFDG